MRILQIIDSLDSGGAEKMAVTFANSLANKISFSGLIATRKEGNLKKLIHSNVNYTFLNKKYAFDISAYFKLRKYCVDHKIQFIHAHSSSYFFSCLIKMTLPKIKIIWHDHNGVGNIPVKEGTVYVQIFSIFFKGIVSVNKQLEEWAKKKLLCKNVIFLPNFVIENNEYKKETTLKGTSGKRILCLANLRKQKNHLMLIEVAKLVFEQYPDWTFHLVGKDNNDDYSKLVKNKIDEYKLATVFLYDSREDIEHIINQSDITVFTSVSEGLPVALLEYGFNKKAVISTKVGEIPFVIKDGESGFLVDINDVATFSNRLQDLINDGSLREKFGKNLFDYVKEHNSEESVIEFYINWIKKN